ncbi:hypothetical protein GCM10009128_23180 [Psychrosphaera haliotis]
MVNVSSNIRSDKKDNKAKLFVLDTNILLHDPHAYFNFQEHDVVIPMTVLEELDHIKDRHKDVSRDARVAIRSLETTLHDVEPEEMIEGVPLNRGELKDSSVTGHLIIMNDHHITSEISGLPGGENDNRIINAALHLQKERPKVTVVLVTKDINMRLKAKGAGLKRVEDYTTDQLIDDIEFLTKGFEQVEGDFWSNVKNVETVKDGRDAKHTVDRSALENVFINEYVLDTDTDFAGRVSAISPDKVELMDLSRTRLMSRKAWGISPKNIYQAMAFNALLDPNIELVILTGPAGCGKTGITASFFSIFVQTYLQTLFLLNKLSIYNRLRSNLSNMSLSVT